MNITVLDAYTLYPENHSAWNSIKELGNCTIYPRTTSDQIIERCKNSELILTNKVPISAETISKLPKLQYIGVLATGYNVVDIEAARDNNIVVTNIPDYSTNSVAQLVFAYILNFTHRVSYYGLTVKEGRWNRSPDFCYYDHEFMELDGSKIGIVGYGKIGRKVSEIARSFGMQVLINTPHPPSSLPEGVFSVNKEKLFKESDIISLHCRLTEENKGLINSNLLSKMKPNALIINTARGPLIDDKALYEALVNAKIGGAALDVLSNEPPKADNPLLNAPNCLITPHIGWTSAAARKRLMKICINNIKNFISNTPINVVNE